MGERFHMKPAEAKPLMWILGVLALVILLPVAGVLWMTAVPGRSHAGPLPPLTPDQAQLAERLRDHVRAVASRPHNVSHPQELEQAALHIEGTLAGMGYELHRQAFRADGQEDPRPRRQRWWSAPTTTAISTRRAPTTTGPERRA